MGKVHRKKTNARKNPTGVPSISDLERASTELQIPAMREEDIVPVIQKLSSPDTSERAWAAACCSNLVQHNLATRRLLCSKGLIKLLIERLIDPPEVLVEVTGTLRNLALIEHELCVEMYNKDIITPLQRLMVEISKTIKAVLDDAPISEKQENEARKLVWDLADNIISIFWSLSENSQKALSRLNKMDIVAYLMAFLSIIPNDKVPLRVSVTAAECLHTLTDDNKDGLTPFKQHPEYTNVLIGIVNNTKNDEEYTLLRVLASGILLNIRHVIPSTEVEDATTEINKLVIPVLSPVLACDIQASAVMAEKISEQIPKEAVDLTKLKRVVSQEEKTLETIEMRLKALQFSLEFLADICSQSTENEWDDQQENNENGDVMLDEDDRDEETMEDEDVETASEAITGKNDAVSEALKCHPIYRILSHEVVPQLVRLAEPFSIPSNLSPTIVEALNTVQLRALECLNNYLLTVAETPGRPWYKEHEEDARRCWTWIFGVAANTGVVREEIRTSMTEVLAGCLWTLARGLEAQVPITDEQIQSLISGLTSGTSGSQARIIGTLGVIARRQGQIETNKMIGQLLLRIVHELPPNGTTSPECAIEALNAIYDVYGDAEYDYDLPVFVEGRFLDALRNSVLPVRAMMKSIDRRKQNELRLRADEALMNLRAFIKYKENERKC
ncbi:uncharacterized protein VTP21DRAFT_9459 [Calcarisporiella thermophila]|uniref:uncharacterized protein n=1 Tax=Calcarisporiella thermophila TaxID=911321 RepID=UPI00374413C8